MRRHLAVTAALTSAVVATLVAALATGIAGRPFSVPVSYAADGLYYGYMIQNTLESGWHLDAPRLGFPFGTGMYDFPIGEHTNVMLVRLLSLFFSDYGSIYNALFLLTFFLAAGVASWVLVRLRVTPWLAAAGGIVFALLPYHFLRAHHLFLGAYWCIPLYVYLALRGFGDDRIVGAKRLLLWTVLLLLAAGAGIYYAYFACLLIGAAALIEAARRKSLRPLGRASLWIAVIAFGVAASLVPNFIYWKEHGRNTEIAARQGVQSERYALKPIQLFLPTPGHRVPALAKVAHEYARVSPYTNENSFAALGVLGASALAVSLIAFFVGVRRYRFVAIAGRYSTMAILYAVVGGLGSAIAYTVLPQIRATSRISVFIAFFCVIVLVRLLQSGVVRNLGRGQRRAAALIACAVAIVAIAVFDQVPAIAYGNQRAFEADRAFFRKVESLLPPGAAVLQLPHVPYPEGPRLNGLDEHNHFRAYLHTRALNLSFGAMKGRPGDKWLCALDSLTPAETAAGAAASGFGAILVATPAYADDGVAVIEALAGLLGPPLLRDQGLALFQLAPALKSTSPPFVAITRHDGFFGWERWPAGISASRATGDASVKVISPKDAKDVPVTLLLRSPVKRQVTVLRRGAELARVELEAGREQPVLFRLDVARGAEVLELKTDAPPTDIGEPGSRPVAFSVAMENCSGR